MKESPQYELLSAFLDGEVSAEERARVEKWLAEDEDARRRLDELRAVGASLQALPATRLGEDLSDRVLRAAEHRILAEPTQLAESPHRQPTAEPFTAGRLLRRFLTPRAIAWSGLAVAVAILLTVFPFGTPDVNRDVARNMKTPGTDQTPLAQVALPEESTVAPASGELSERESLGDPRGPQFRSEARAREEFAGTTRGLPVAAKTAPSKSARALKSRSTEKTDKSAYGYKTVETPATEQAEPFAAKPSAPKREPAMDSGKRKAGSSTAKGRSLGRADHGSSQRSPGKSGRSYDTLGVTPMQRAVRNQPALLVVNCQLTTSALREKAFSKTLGYNNIDVVTLPEQERPLAEQLVRGSAPVPPTTPGAAIPPPPRDTRQKTARVPTSPAKTQLGALADFDGAVDDDELDRSVLALPSDANAEVVLVEGSPAQIAATLADLRRRNDVFVSISPQTANRDWYAPRQQPADENLSSRFADSKAAGFGVTAAEGEQEAGQQTIEALRIHPQQLTAGGEGVQQQQQAQHAAAPRGTALRLGTVALRREPVVTDRLSKSGIKQEESSQRWGMPADRSAANAPPQDALGESPYPATTPAPAKPANAPATEPPTTAALSPPAEAAPARQLPDRRYAREDQEQAKPDDASRARGMGGMGGAFGTGNKRISGMDEGKAKSPTGLPGLEAPDRKTSRRGGSEAAAQEASKQKDLEAAAKKAPTPSGAVTGARGAPPRDVVSKDAPDGFGLSPGAAPQSSAEMPKRLRENERGRQQQVQQALGGESPPPPRMQVLFVLQRAPNGTRAAASASVAPAASPAEPQSQPQVVPAGK